MRWTNPLEIPSSFAVALLGALTVSCGDDETLTTTTPEANPAPIVYAIDPPYAVEDGEAFLMEILGSGFVPETTLSWNGSVRETLYESPTMVRAVVTAADIAAPPGSTSDWEVSVWLESPVPGGGASAVIPYAIRQVRPVPTITSISPDHSPLYGPGLTLDVVGTNFREDTVVRWGPFFTGLITTYHSPTHLTAAVHTPQLGNPGTVAVSASNPRPGGGGSNEVHFVVGSRRVRP